MASASKLVPFILRWEGGFVDHPLDKGGATNKGVTWNTFKGRYPNGTIEDLKSITDQQWMEIFKDGYWNPCQGNLIDSQSVANIIVDWAWASGTRTVIRKIQGMLGVREDGVVGRVTLNAINNRDPRELFYEIKQARLDFIEAIIKRNPSQSVFRNGWINRIKSIEFSS